MHTLHPQRWVWLWLCLRQHLWQSCRRISLQEATRLVWQVHGAHVCVQVHMLAIGLCGGHCLRASPVRVPDYVSPRCCFFAVFQLAIIASDCESQNCNLGFPC
jgi:hypothetical protein